MFLSFLFQLMRLLSKIDSPFYIFHRRQYYWPACFSLWLIHIDSSAAAQLYALDSFPLSAGRLSRTEEGVCDGAEGFGFAGRTGAKGVSVLVLVPRDVKGVALSVAKPVNDGAAKAALLLYGLLERLCLTPVQPQVSTLSDVQRFLAGLRHFVC